MRDAPCDVRRRNIWPLLLEIVGLCKFIPDVSRYLTNIWPTVIVCICIILNACCAAGYFDLCLQIYSPSDVTLIVMMTAIVAVGDDNLGNCIEDK